MEEELRAIVRKVLTEELTLDIIGHSDFDGDGFEVILTLGDKEIAKDYYHITSR